MRRLRESRWPLFVGVLMLALIPQVVFSASGSFSSSSTAPALRAVNTDTGKAGVFKSRNESASVSVSNTSTGGETGRRSALLGKTAHPNGTAIVGMSRNDDAGAAGVGVRGFTAGELGNGVEGIAPGEVGWGVFGDGAAAGVVGYGGIGVMGSGFYGVMSDGLLSTNEHLVDECYGACIAEDDGDIVGNVSGQCTIPPMQTSSVCAFATAFDGSYMPTVVATPTTNPGAFWWVTAVTAGGFELHLGAAPEAGVTFNWVVVGLLSPESEPASASIWRR